VSWVLLFAISSVLLQIDYHAFPNKYAATNFHERDSHLAFIQEIRFCFENVSCIGWAFVVLLYFRRSIVFSNLIIGKLYRGISFYLVVYLIMFCT